MTWAIVKGGGRAQLARARRLGHDWWWRRGFPGYWDCRTCSQYVLMFGDRLPQPRMAGVPECIAASLLLDGHPSRGPYLSPPCRPVAK